MDDKDAVYHNTAECRVAVGVLMGETFGIAHYLQISWADRETMEEQWQLLHLCSHWRVSALYGEKTTLRLYGSGEPILAGPPEESLFGVMQQVLIPVYSAEWTLPDAWAAREFIQGVRQRGYFVMLPAVEQFVCQDFPPLFAFLHRGES